MDALTREVSETQIEIIRFETEVTKGLADYELALVGGGIGDVVLG